MADGTNHNPNGAKERLFALLSGHEFEASDEDYWAPVEKPEVTQPASVPWHKGPTYFSAASFEEFSARAVESFRYEPKDSVAKLYPDQLRNWSGRRTTTD